MLRDQMIGLPALQKNVVHIGFILILCKSGSPCARSTIQSELFPSLLGKLEIIPFFGHTPTLFNR